MYHFPLPYLFFWQNVAFSRVLQFRLLLLSCLCRLHSSLLVSSGRCGSFLGSSTRTPSACCLHMLQGIIFTCLICPPGRCGSFFRSTAAVEDEYSRVIPCKNKDKGKDREKA
ncbi:hypothetical protein ACFX2H_031563 [Malus domestica]